MARSGIQFSAMSAASQAAAVAVARAALSDQGFADFTGIRAADDYLGTMSTGGGGATYSSRNYYVALFGTPSDTGAWMLAIGGHHMAYNLTLHLDQAVAARVRTARSALDPCSAGRPHA